MNYLAVLGRQPEISLAELEALFSDVRQISANLAIFSTGSTVDIDRLGGTLKLAEKMDVAPLEYLKDLPDGKVTIGVSDYSKKASRKIAQMEALRLKKVLVRNGRSVRVVENKEAVLSTAASLYNGLSGKNSRKVELIKVENDWYKVIGVQDIDAYAKRDQARPARDAKVGMLPPKLAQILINLCGPLPLGSCILDPFCGTGVVLQEALLMGYLVYGTDINERMVEYAEKNLDWLMKLGKYPIRGISERGSARRSAPRPWQAAEEVERRTNKFVLPRRRLAGDFSRRAEATRPENGYFRVSYGDATSFRWKRPIDAVACESYLGQPMSQIPSEIKLKEQKQECGTILIGFLKNLADQIKAGTPVVVAAPAWLREDGTYSRLEIVDRLDDMGYNVNNKSREGLLYRREGQIVARDILILRKK